MMGASRGLNPPREPPAGARRWGQIFELIPEERVRMNSSPRRAVRYPAREWTDGGYPLPSVNMGGTTEAVFRPFTGGRFFCAVVPGQDTVDAISMKERV